MKNIYSLISSYTSATVTALALSMLAGISIPAASHEFWMEPDTYRPDIGQNVNLHHFIGQKFKGQSYPYVPEWFKSFAITQDGKRSNITGTMGDDPAAVLNFEQPGLKILTFHSTPDKLTFKSFKKFKTYLIFEGLEPILTQYEKQLSQQTQFREDYVRCSKTLMQVGDEVTGTDQATGMPLELVAQQNPFSLKKGQSLGVQLLKDGKPLAGALIRILTKTDPEKIKPVRTDNQGRALIALPHTGPYLLNAVAMINQGLPKKDEPWQSLWASLSFSIR